MTFAFHKATKQQSRARIALTGPSGSGKTYSALAIATALGERVAVLDTERGSASKYADEFHFDVLELESFSPDTYVEALEVAESSGYDVIVIDSLSHAWEGKGGVREQVDNRGGRFDAWRDVTPKQNAMLDSILRSRAHVIATMRSKTEYVVEENERGKKVPRKVGTAPVQRSGIEFEFDIIGDMDHRHVLTISKSRCKSLADQVIPCPGVEVAEALKVWLSDGEPVPESLTDIYLTRLGEAQSIADIAAVKADIGTDRAKLSKSELRRLSQQLTESTQRIESQPHEEAS